jgi:hypothetical protein
MAMPPSPVPGGGEMYAAPAEPEIRKDGLLIERFIDNQTHLEVRSCR